MRKLLVATMMCAGVVMQAQAANLDPYAPEMKAYLNFGFGAPQVQSLGLHYGFRMDHDRGYQAQIGRVMPSMMQLDFTAASGFDSALINGQPFMKRTVQLNQDGDASAPAESTGSSGGMFDNFTMLDWGLAAVGVVGIGFGVTQIASSDESDDPAPAAAAGGAGGTGLPGLPGLPALPGAGGLPGLPGLPLLTSTDGYVIEVRDMEYNNWLNAGTGHMGDLIAQ